MKINNAASAMGKLSHQKSPRGAEYYHKLAIQGAKALWAKKRAEKAAKEQQDAGATNCQKLSTVIEENV